VCFENRYENQRLHVSQMIEDGYLGRPFSAQSHTIADYWHPSRGLQSEWMYKTDEGGGYLMGMSSHDIDFLCHLFGEPVSVCADVRSSVPQRPRPDGTTLEVDADDTSVVLMRMSSGALVSISVSVVGLLHNRRSLDLLGSEGTIALDGSVQGGEPTIRSAKVGEEAMHPVTVPDRMPRSGLELPKRRAAGAIRSLALLLEDWLPALEGKPAPGVPNLTDGWRVQQVIDAARRSSAGEGWVSLS
jgi:predicted dehydrogenase